MGITVDIYTNPLYRKCANGGISERVDRLTVVNVSGPSEPSDEAPAALLMPNALGTAKVVPATLDAKGVYVPVRTPGIGPMMGGSYVATSDSRFNDAVREIVGKSFYGALPLHDRYETVEEYRLLSM